MKMFLLYWFSITMATIVPYKIVANTFTDSNEVVFEKIKIQKPGGSGYIEIGFDEKNQPTIRVYDSRNELRYQVGFTDSTSFDAMLMGRSQSIRTVAERAVTLTSRIDGDSNRSALATIGVLYSQDKPGGAVALHDYDETSNVLLSTMNGAFHLKAWNNDYEIPFLSLYGSDFMQALNFGIGKEEQNLSFAQYGNLRIYSSPFVGSGIVVGGFTSEGPRDRIILHADDINHGPAGLLMYDSSGNKIAGLGLNYDESISYLLIQNDPQHVMLTTSDGFSSAVLGTEKEQNILLQSTPNGDASIQIADRDKVLFELSEVQGDSRMTLYDASGRARVAIGRTQLNYKGGRSLLSPPSSIHLFDESGTSVFSAP